MFDKKHNNITAVIIGFFLIVIIAVITFYHPQSNKSAQDNAPSTVPESDSSQKPSNKLESEELMGKIKSKQAIIIIDTRAREAFQQEHILDSKNIPFADIEKSLPDLEKNKTYVIMDDGSAIGSSLADGIFPGNGIEDVFYLDGGFPAWKKANEPTISSGDPSSFADQSKVNYVKSDQLKDLLSTEGNLAIIDLRSSSHYKESHLPGAINIFIDDLESKRGKIPVGKKIILYDKDGLWAFQGAVRLFDMGFFNVFCLSDGLDSWQQKKYPLAK